MLRPGVAAILDRPRHASFPVGRFPPAVVAGALIVIVGCCVALFAGWALGHGARWGLWTLAGFNMLWLVAIVVAPYAYVRNRSLEGGWEFIGYAAFVGGPGLVLGLTSLVLVLRILLNPTRFQWLLPGASPPQSVA